MHSIRKRRLLFIMFVVVSMGTATTLTLYALRKNIDLYYTPTQLSELKAEVPNKFRAGGLVVKGSLKYLNRSLAVNFLLSDGQSTLPVYYQGVLPALFREGQGIVVHGHLNAQHVLIADQVLAKHDANYHPSGTVVQSTAKKEVG